MSKAKLSQIKIPPEARKFPFDQTFLCPKCSEILFVNIHYIDATMIPQVTYKCPKRHSGTVDLLLFFNLFHSSNKEIEEELSKFDEKLEKDIELFKTKKNKERKKILDPVNFAKIINKKNKEKEEEQNKEKNNNEENENKNKEEIKKEKEKEEENKKLFVEIQKCNEIKFSLLNIKKEKEPKKLLEKQHPKSESKTAEKKRHNLFGCHRPEPMKRRKHPPAMLKMNAFTITRHPKDGPETGTQRTMGGFAFGHKTPARPGGWPGENLDPRAANPWRPPSPMTRHPSGARVKDKPFQKNASYTAR